MALVKGTNSYATVAEADTYLADRLDSATWTSAYATLKAQALITATSYLDGLRWLGSATSTSQALAFPRIGEIFDPRAGCVISLDSAVVPTRIVNATIELAFHLINNANILNEPSTSENVEVGSITLTKMSSVPVIPSFINNMIKPLRINSNVWWRAN